MVASPDHLLDPRYYPEQDEEREVTEEIIPLGQFVTVRCIGCSAEKVTRANGLLTKAQHTAFVAAVLLRDKWFVRNNEHNRIEAICPRCGDAAHRHLMTW